MTTKSPFKIAPKNEQPKGGYKHPKHLLAYGPKHKAWSLADGWYETTQYCIAPSHSQYEKKFLNE